MPSKNNEILEQEVLNVLEIHNWKLPLDIVKEIARERNVDGPQLFCSSVYTHLERLVEQGVVQRKLADSSELVQQGRNTKIYYYCLTEQGSTKKYNI